MRNLVESILEGNLLEAKEFFDEKMEIIREQKLYEEKRMISAQMDEVAGSLTPAEVEAKKKAGYSKAADVLGDPAEGRKKRMRRKAPPAPSKTGGKKYTELDWMTPEKRRATLDARRAARVADLEKTDAAKAERVKGALRTAHAADVTKAVKRKVVPVAKNVGGRVGKGLSAALGNLSAQYGG